MKFYLLTLYRIAGVKFALIGGLATLAHGAATLTGEVSKNNLLRTETPMRKLVRKQVLLDPQALKRAQKILNKDSEAETIREAINLVTLRKEVVTGFDRVAGKAPDFRDVWAK
jgi:hypothetical protein